MVRINGLFHLLINGDPLILTFDPDFQRDIQVGMKQSTLNLQGRFFRMFPSSKHTNLGVRVHFLNHYGKLPSETFLNHLNLATLRSELMSNIISLGCPPSQDASGK